MLKTESYVHRFGVKVVLNSVSPDNIRKVDKITMEELPVRSQIQASKSTSISSFSIDAYTDYMRGMVGSLMEGDELGNIIAGKDEFKFSLDIKFSEIRGICKSILKRYKSNKYKDIYDWYDNLKQIEDPELVEELDKKLIKEILEFSSEKVYLAPTKIVDWTDIEFSYTEQGDRFDDLNIDNFFDYLKARNRPFDLDNLKKSRVYVWKDTGEDEKWKIYDCLVYEYIKDDILYVLTNGNWFEVEKDFVKKVDEYIRDIPETSIDLPEYNHDSEGDYNIYVGENFTNLISLDKVTPWIENHRGKIEFCDLLSNENHLVHVKHWKGSSTLSHLFAQGRVSAVSLINNLEYRNKIREEIKQVDESFLAVLEDENIRPSNLYIVYAIIYKNNKPIHERLPFFSKLNMRQSVQQLREMQFNVEKIKIKNIKN